MRKSLALVASILLASSLAQASQFRRFDRSTQVTGSDVILVGRVADGRAQWTADRSVIFTDTEIVVDDVWKGALADNRVVVRTLGGAVDGIELKVDGSPTLAGGERVVLFLVENDGVFTPWGMKYGKLTVEGDGEEAFALGSLPTAADGIGADSEVVSLTLTDLRTEVLNAMEAR